MAASTPGINLCAVSNGLSSSTFSATTGNYSFTTTDSTTYPPGTYNFEITLTIGAST
jgi:hypothetical protein